MRPASQSHIRMPKAASGNSADHLVPIASPQNTPVASRHGRHSSSGPHESGDSRWPDGTWRADPLPAPVAVGDHAADRAQHEEGHEDVEQGEAGEHQLQAVEAHQQAGDQAQQGRPGDPSGQPDHHHHHQRRRRPPRRPASRTGVIPKVCSPSAMSHLPTSGWTTMFGMPFQRPVVWPARISSLAFVDVVLGVAEVQQSTRRPWRSRSRRRGTRAACRGSTAAGTRRAA